MPLSKKKTNKAFKSNVKELVSSKPGESREKAIHTYMKEHNVPYEKAKTKIALAIAYNIKE